MIHVDIHKHIKYLALSVVIVLWYLLIMVNHDLLYIIQDFTPIPSLADRLSHPGGLREYVADWLTQLFYYPWLGGTVMALMWLLSVWALIRAFRLSGPQALLSTIPVMAMLTGITELGYWTFCLKAAGYWFGPTLGLVSVSMMMWLYNALPVRWHYALIFLWILIGYPALGWYATLGTVLMLVHSYYKSAKDFVFMIFSVSVPSVILYIAYKNTLGIHWREPMLLYGFHHLHNPEAQSILLEVTFWIMALSLVIMAVIARINGGAYSEPPQKNSRIIAWCVSLPLFLLVVSATSMMQYHNRNFCHELVMLRDLENGDWDGILKEMSDLQHRPTREMVMMKDIALAQQGRLGDEAFKYDFRGVHPEMNINLPIHMAHSAAPYFYYWLGLPNFAFMWCMEDNIEYGLSPYFLKLMYRCSLANGEERVAAKYKAMLSETLFYKDFHVSKTELQSVHQFMTGHDDLTNDRGFSESFLMNRLSHEQFCNAKAQQVAVYYAMLMRNKDSFNNAVARLDSLTHNAPLPIHFQEAQVQFTHGDSIKKLNSNIRTAYAAYYNAVGKYLSMGEPRESVGKSIFSEFGNTYWWYYDFYTSNKTY